MDPPNKLVSTAAVDPVVFIAARQGIETALSQGKM